MSIKHLVAVLLLASLLFCGIAAAAEATSLTINVYDNSAAHDPVKDAKVVITKSGTSLSQTLYTTSDGIVEFPSVEYKSTYSVTVTKDGFDEQKFSIDVNTMGKEYTVYLQKSNLVQVKVLNTDKSTPVAGAEISVDGLAMGTTNSAGVLHVSMEKGVYHNIQVTADSYETYTSSQYIETDQTSLTITLSKSYFSPRILVYDADNDMKPVSLATVIVDGKTVGTTDEYGRATLNDLTAGTYTLEVTKPNYNSYKNTVTFTEDSSDVIVELTYAVVPLTVLVVDGNNPVAGATIYIDNLVTGLTDTTGKFTKDVEPGKTILITASKDGYATQSISWSVTADQNNTVTVPITQNFPVALVGGIIAVIIIIGVVVFLVKAKGSSTFFKTDTVRTCWGSNPDLRVRSPEGYPLPYRSNVILFIYLYPFFTLSYFSGSPQHKIQLPLKTNKKDMLLSSSAIRARINDGTLGITPFAEESLQPASYDLRAAEDTVMKTGELSLIATMEFVSLPADLAATLRGRSSVEKGTRIVQMLIHPVLGEVENVYNGNYQDSYGVVKSKI